MTFDLTIRRKLLGLSCIGLGLVLLVGAVGYWTVARLTGTMQQMNDNGGSLQSQMAADMAHDALRSDVLNALLSGHRKDADGHKQAAADLDEHAKDFRESIESASRRASDPAILQALTKVRPGLTAYIDSATEMVRLAGTDAEAAQARLGDFAKVFKTLETEMGELNELMEARNTATQAEGQQIGATTTLAIVIAAAVSAAILFVLGVLTSRSITRPIDQAVKIAQTVASGDLGSRIEVRGVGETAQLLTALQAMNHSLLNVVGTVRQSSDSIATGSAEIASGNADLSQRTEVQASNLQQTAASMAQLTTTVRQNADTAARASQLAASASAVAAQGGDMVNQVVSTMDAMSASSKKIAEIIGVIDGIAFQTNILALNAAVEAARAGEQGRGFAVVAGEVRGLAQRSAQAAKEIKTLIGDSVEKVAQGSERVGAAGKTMQEILSQVRQVQQLIDEISTASTEQSAGIQQVGDAVMQMDHVTQQNSALVEESAAAAESLRNQAAVLAEAVAVFKFDVAAR